MGSEDKKLAKIFKDVREKAGIHFNYYARVERGEMTLRVDIVENIARALKINLRLPPDK